MASYSGDDQAAKREWAMKRLSHLDILYSGGKAIKPWDTLTMWTKSRNLLER